MVRMGVWMVMLGAAQAAAGQVIPPSYGLDFVTIGAPGNRDTIPEEVPTNPTFKFGRVNHTYRIMRTEITYTRWLEFVEAYAPWAPKPKDSEFTGLWIFPKPGGTYAILPGAEEWPAVMGWRYAARYANWLHNGKVVEQWAFESGAYDTSTFTPHPNGYGYNDQLKHSKGARFWIPTYDEWLKAAHYDPDRYGPGQEGYWMYPDGGNEPLISGFPEDGGETNAGETFPSSVIGMDVGSYPQTLSPWGLLDVSGSESEWTETSFIGPGYRAVARSGIHLFSVFDILGEGLDPAFVPTFPMHTFRLASVPNISTSVVIAVPLLITLRRRR